VPDAAALQSPLDAGSTAAASVGRGVAGGGSATALGRPKPWYVLSHVSTTYHLLDRFILACCAWELLMQPLMLAFWAQTGTMVWLIDAWYALNAIYVLRVAMRLHTSFVNAKSVIIYDPSDIGHHYLATEFAFDVFMSWPHNLFALALDAKPEVITSPRLLRLGLCRYLWRAYAMRRGRRGRPTTTC
jgi:hypothetical protein